MTAADTSVTARSHQAEPAAGSRASASAIGAVLAVTIYPVQHGETRVEEPAQLAG